MRESGAVVEWSLEGKAESIKDAFYTLEQDKPVDILIALGNDETEMMVDFLPGMSWAGDLTGARCTAWAVPRKMYTIWTRAGYRRSWFPMNSIWGIRAWRQSQSS